METRNTKQKEIILEILKEKENMFHPTAGDLVKLVLDTYPSIGQATVYRNINKLVDEVYSDKTMMKQRGNGIYLSDNDIEVLNRYNINYLNYSSLNSLIFNIEQILNEETDLNDLEEVSRKLSELNYYNNTNK